MLPEGQDPAQEAGTSGTGVTTNDEREELINTEEQMEVDDEAVARKLQV